MARVSPWEWASTPPSLRPLLWRERPASASDSKQHVFSLLSNRITITRNSFSHIKNYLWWRYYLVLKSFLDHHNCDCVPWFNAITVIKNLIMLCLYKEKRCKWPPPLSTVYRAWTFLLQRSHERALVCSHVSHRTQVLKGKGQSIHVCIHIQTKAESLKSRQLLFRCSHTVDTYMAIHTNKALLCQLHGEPPCDLFQFVIL